MSRSGPDRAAAAAICGASAAAGAVHLPRSGPGAPSSATACVILYAGEVAEEATTREIFTDPRHPYTRRCWSATRPGFEEADAAPADHPGRGADLVEPPPGCVFHPRCPRAEERCRREVPGRHRIPGHAPGALPLRGGAGVSAFRYQSWPGLTGPSGAGSAAALPYFLTPRSRRGVTSGRIPHERGGAAARRRRPAGPLPHARGPPGAARARPGPVRRRRPRRLAHARSRPHPGAGRRERLGQDHARPGGPGPSPCPGRHGAARQDGPERGCASASRPHSGARRRSCSRTRSRP